MLQETVSKPLPATVEVTLPVFAPDHSRPYFGKGHRILGYHSRLVGWTEFHNVPVTPINPLDFYERQFGLLNNFW